MQTFNWKFTSCFCFVVLKIILFDLFCLFGPFFFLFQNAGSQLCSRFFFFKLGLVQFSFSIRQLVSTGLVHAVQHVEWNDWSGLRSACGICFTGGLELLKKRKKKRAFRFVEPHCLHCHVGNGEACAMVTVTLKWCLQFCIHEAHQFLTCLLWAVCVQLCDWGLPCLCSPSPWVGRIRLDVFSRLVRFECFRNFMCFLMQCMNTS